MRPIRILYLIDSLGRRGGAERQLALELGALPREQFCSHVCYLHPPAYLEPLFQSMGIATYRLNVAGAGQWPSGLRKLRALVKSLGIDLIHTSLYHADVLGGLAGRWTGVPVVSTLTGTGYDPEWMARSSRLGRVKLAVPRTVRSFVGRHCNREIIAVSQSVKTYAVRKLGLSSDRISVIYRALSPEWLEKGERRPVPTPAGDNGLLRGFPTIINVGRLEVIKGQRYLIESMPGILQHFPQAVLLIVGEGSLQGQFQALIDQLGLQDRAFLLGQRSDVPHLLQSSDIFALPSLSEGCPNALIEAMAMGVPSVASNIAPVAEVTQGGKLASLVAPRSARSLAEGVVALANHLEDARLMGQEAREAVRDRFALTKAVGQRMEVYQRCVVKVGE